MKPPLPEALTPQPQTEPFSILQRIDEFVFPPICFVCGTRGAVGKKSRLCKRCMLKIQRTLSLYSSCPRCGQELNCGPCKCETKWEYPFERIVPFTDFSAPDVRTIIHHIKYRKKKQLAYFMGELCATDFNRLITEPFDYAVPVPLHWIKKKMRGFNQAEWFCRGLLHGQKRDRPPIILNCALRRRRYTKKQAGLRRPERWKNVDNAFAVIRSAKPLLAGKSVLLVDDVITTGATCAAASIALISAGCRSVTVLALARD